MHFFFFFKHKTAYEMRISDWSSDVCSSDLVLRPCAGAGTGSPSQRRDPRLDPERPSRYPATHSINLFGRMINAAGSSAPDGRTAHGAGDFGEGTAFATPAGHRSQRSGISRRSEEHTSELQPLMRRPYAVF